MRIAALALIMSAIVCIGTVLYMLSTIVEASGTGLNALYK